MFFEGFMKTELDAGSFFLSNPTRNPKLAAELIRGGPLGLCHNGLLELCMKTVKQKHALL